MANSAIAFLDHQIESGRGDDVAIVSPHSRYTYSDVLALANRAGNLFRRLGVEPEQRVSLLLPDGPIFAAAYFGALRIGAVAIPLNTRLNSTDYTAILQDSRSKILVVDATLFDRLGSDLGDLPHLHTILTSSQSAGRESFEALLTDASPDLDPEPMSDDDMAFWLYTSGTTGFPKAAVHLHRDLIACQHYCMDVLGANEADRVFATSKLFFAYALGNAFLIPFFVGAQTFLHPAWADPEVVKDVLLQFKPTLFFSVPTFYARMLRANPSPDLFRSVRLAVSAGERLPAEIYKAWRDRFGLEIVEGMGSTETIFMVLSNRPGTSRAGSSGTPVLGTEARILDAKGKDVSVGEQGVLHVKTPSASQSYWNRVELSRRTFIGDWFRTGDLYSRDADGFYYHSGREDDLFKVAGMWVSPTEVEAILQGHPGLTEIGVVGCEEPGGLPKPFAFVVAKDPTDMPESLVASLKEFAEQRLPPHQRPRNVFVLPELPRTATGKIQRFKLREQVRVMLKENSGL